ncbi:MAG: lamin tail domain-containing protein [Gammaproteobacteria bacterium]|nr:MAG: lamin tail domain-containing protein [Gammaproteobacteria bacterium]
MKYFHTLLLTLAVSSTLWLTTAYATPIISEVLYDGSGGDADDVFTEIYGAPGMLLDGWTLTGINGSDGATYRVIDLSGVIIPADGYLVIATASAQIGLASLVDFIANVDWQNGPDSIQLRDPTGIVMDALQYGDAGIHNHGEGAPAAAIVAGHSLARMNPTPDMDNNQIDFIDLSAPTPGTGPYVSEVTEPWSISMLLTGIILLLRRQRSPMYQREIHC